MNRLGGAHRAAPASSSEAAAKLRLPDGNGTEPEPAARGEPEAEDDTQPIDHTCEGSCTREGSQSTQAVKHRPEVGAHDRQLKRGPTTPRRQMSHRAATPGSE